MIRLLLNASKAKLMTDGYLKPRDTYSDDVLTEKRKKVKTTNL